MSDSDISIVLPSALAKFSLTREVLSCSRTDWLILTNSPLTGPALSRKLREAEARGTVEIDEGPEDTVITFTPHASLIPTPNP